MEKELKKYKSTNSFLFTTDLNVEEVCNATSRENLIDELGDVLWYVTVLTDNAGLNLDDIMLRNINKLEKRALNGK